MISDNNSSLRSRNFVLVGDERTSPTSYARTFYETVLSIHINLQFQMRSVGEAYKDLNITSSSLSADRVKCEPESIKGFYEQTP